jgi:coenzyme F420-0:L-glutamate ligase/coenzyme F420-1:gamma-L-glutamate ligase
VVRTRVGPVLAAAGSDASDVPDGVVLLLPADPDGSARALRARLHELTGARPAVLVTDTSSRPWRDGVSDFALGAAGLAVLDDVRGRVDRAGRTLEVTVRGVADETAGAADLVKGKAAGTPVAVVRGLGAHVTADDGPGARVLVRGQRGDWFRHGHVEAVWLALGHVTDESPSIDPAAEDLRQRVDRAVRVATAPLADKVSAQVSDADGSCTVRLDAEPYALGRAVERLAAAAWAEDLVVGRAHRDASGASLRMAYGGARD